VNVSSTQKISLIEIPMLITYNFSVKQFSLQIATGASVGVFTNITGNHFEFGDPIISEESTKSLFNSLQYNYLLRTELAYSLSDNWQISASPNMKLNLNSLYKNDSGFNNRYLFYGINAGIVYHF
jgi:hypothetical protein